MAVDRLLGHGEEDLSDEAVCVCVSVECVCVCA